MLIYRGSPKRYEKSAFKISSWRAKKIYTGCLSEKWIFYKAISRARGDTSKKFYRLENEKS